eukprot:959397-Prymnesium_polylepis.1
MHRARTGLHFCRFKLIEKGRSLLPISITEREPPAQPQQAVFRLRVGRRARSRRCPLWFCDRALSGCADWADPRRTPTRSQPEPPQPHGGRS